MTLSPACTPVPVTLTLVLAPLLFTTVTMPLTAPAEVGWNCTVIVALAEGAIVVDAPIPVTEIPPPVTFTCEIVTLLFPVLEIVTVLVELAPVLILPNARLFGAALIEKVAALEVPLSATVVAEAEAFEVSDRLPVLSPAAFGAYCTLNVSLCPAEMLSGVLKPFTLKPVPERLAAEIVRVAFPVFETVTVWLFDCPLIRLPKSMLAGETLMAACAPVPVKSTVPGDPGALLLIDSFPLDLPLPFGENAMENDELLPAAIVKGAVNPVTAKSVPLIVAEETLSEAEPVLVKVTVWLLDEPLFTLPKSMLAGETLSAACTPDPVKASDAGELEASLTTEMLPVEDSTAVGAYFT